MKMDGLYPGVLRSLHWSSL